MDTMYDESLDYCSAMETLGYVFTCAANDVHTVHVNAVGKDFTTLHSIANEMYDYLAECADTCFEISCECGGCISNINDAANLIDWDSISKNMKRTYSLIDGVQTIIDTLHIITCEIEYFYNMCPSNVQSTLDEWQRYLTSKMNYFLGRIVQCESDVCSDSMCSTHVYATESIMLRNTRHKKPCVCEHLEYLKLGQSYRNFCQVEDHIDDYNCDTLTLKPGDCIIRDFQFGHLPNGGNKGYIPYEVVDIEYDRDSDVSGYRDVRKRLHLYDGHEDFYIECYNDRFNGIFHKLKRSSIKK